MATPLLETNSLVPKDSTASVSFMPVVLIVFQGPLTTVVSLHAKKLCGQPCPLSEGFRQFP